MSTPEKPKRPEAEIISAGDDRPVWRRKLEFILVMVGYNVGLGNVWRFPYLCYKHGGGAFLIAYGISAITTAIPMYFLEVSLGQFTKQSAIGAWKILPSMKGIGIANVVCNIYSCVYYILVLVWSVLYFVHSLIPGPLPWTSCDQWWNSDTCVSHFDKLRNSTNVTIINNVTNIENATTPEMEFWLNYVLRKSEGIDSIGLLNNVPLIICFLCSWIIVYFCVFKGIRSAGKVVYVTAIVPYILLFVLLIRGVTLDGASSGIAYLFKTDFSKLIESQVWVEAGGQTLYSYCICFSVLTTYGSYNKFNNNCYRQSIVLTVSCSLTSFLASFVIFSILGHMALVQNKDISEVATSGPGLAFLVYPTGLSLLPLPRVWAIIFFFTLLMVGIDSVFSCVEGAVSAFMDAFPWTRRQKYGREKTSAMAVLFFAILGLPLLTHGGIYVFELFNVYAVGGISLFMIVLFESLTIGWIYGVDRFYDNIKSMIGYYPSPYFKICYRFLCPSLTMFIFLFCCVKYRPLVLDDYVYPPWANAIGWTMALSSVLCIPIFFCVSLWKSNGSLRERLASNLRPPVAVSRSELETLSVK